jgi:hypothetical protein
VFGEYIVAIKRGRDGFAKSAKPSDRRETPTNPIRLTVFFARCARSETFAIFAFPLRPLR